MKTAKITPLSIQQYIEISENIYDETERVEQGDILAAKCVKHPDYGDIILISSTHGSCLMIHFTPDCDLQSSSIANFITANLTP